MNPLVLALQAAARHRHAGLLLDIYSGAAAAYSLRQLRTAFTGDVILVRRSGDDAESGFTSAEITDGTLAAWVTAGGGTEDGFVKTWYDQSGNSNNAIQATAGNQPQIVAAGAVVTEGGKPAINFVDSSYGAIGHYLELDNWYAADTQTVWAFSVYVLKQNGTYPYILGTGSGDKGILLLHNGATRAARLGTARISGITTGNGTILDQNTQYIRSSMADRTSVSEWVNGTISTTFADKDSDFDMPVKTWIGSTNINSILVDINIQEIILYAFDKSSNRSDIETNINNHYGIY